MAVCEWLWMQGPDFCHDRIFKPVPIQDSCICVLRIMLETNDNSAD